MHCARRLLSFGGGLAHSAVRPFPRSNLETEENLGHENGKKSTDGRRILQPALAQSPGRSEPAPAPWPKSTENYPILRNNASGPEIELPGRISSNRESLKNGPPSGRGRPEGRF